MYKQKHAILALAALAAVPLFATTRYVVPAGTPGNSPASPYDTLATAANDIATAISVSTTSDTILVAPGTYSVGATISANQTSLTIRSFNSQTGEEDRDNTILDGGGTTAIMQTTAVGVTVSGFTFANGYQSSDEYSNIGSAAFRPMADNVTISNCVFRGNRSLNVTGTCIHSSNKGLVVADCVFTNNSQTITVAGKNARGVAVYTGQSSANAWTESELPRITGCLFDGNSAQAPFAFGPVIYLNSNTIIDNCTFLTNSLTQTDNTQNTEGGLIYCGRYTSLLNSRFSCIGFNNANGKYLYGTVLQITGGNVTLSNCTFNGVLENPGSNMYGTIHIGTDNVQFLDCHITNCTLKGSAFVFVENKGGVVFRNCLFAGNTRGSVTAIIRRFGDKVSVEPSVTVDNCTFADSSDDVYTLYMDTKSSAYTMLLRNSIFTQEKLYSGALGCTMFASNCCFSALLGGTTYSECMVLPKGGHKFMCAADGDYRLRCDSPLRDKGTMLDWMTTAAKDIDQNPRVVSHDGVPLASDPAALPDIGCYERQSDTPDYTYVKRLVSSPAEATGDWVGAFTDFQTAIDGTPDGWRLLVKPGLYQPAATLVISNRNLEVVSFDANGQPDPDNTVIDAQGARRVMIVHWGESLAAVDPNAKYWRPVILNGLTFKNGVALTNGPTASQPFAGNGGGVVFYGRAPSRHYSPSRLVNCRFVNCEAFNGGGAALLGGWVENCTFSGCTADHGGGACSIEYKSTSAQSADYTLSESWYSCSLHGCTFLNNVAHSFGGGYSCSSDASGRRVYIENCTFMSNSVDTTVSTWSRSGGAISYALGSLITNCTFTGNSAGGYGIIYALAKVHGVDLVFKDNDAPDTGNIYCTSLGTVFERCQFIEDPSKPTGALFGGGTFRNCLIVNNSGKFCLMQYSSTRMDLENCTVVNKNGYLIEYRSPDAEENRVLTLVNCILWRQSGTFARTCAKYNSVYATNCCFSAEVNPAIQYFHQTGCFVNANPGFTSVADNDFTLRSNTCREKGVMLDWLTGADVTDLLGNPRVVSLYGVPYADDPTALPDLGCYERQKPIIGFHLIFH